MASEVKERLLRYLRFKRISQVEFTRALGVSSTYIGAMRRSMSDDKMSKVRELYPDLNPDWLLYGRGEMLIPGPAESRQIQMESYGVRMVPLIPSAAYAGNIQAYSEGVKAADCEQVATQIRAAEMAIKVSGDSMEPSFHDGTVLFVKRIESRSFIPWGLPLVVDTDNGVMFKCLYPSERPQEMLEARSLNPAYPPFNVPCDCIYAIYRVLGSLTVYNTI